MSDRNPRNTQPGDRPTPILDYFRIKRVSSFAELATTPFADGINALCWARSLSGDFGSVVQLLDQQYGASAVQAPSENEGLTTLDPAAIERLLTFPPSSFVLSPSTRAAIEILLEDLRLLRDLHRDPVLNLIHGYPRDDSGGPVPTDVFSFHADSAPIAADTWLCTYHGPPSEGLRNEDAVRKIDVPKIRAELLTLHSGPDDASFQEFLHENHFDLHYAPKLSALSDQPPALLSSSVELSPLNPQLSTSSSIYSFGHFNLWRIACEYPNAPVPPCIHRAPSTSPNDPPRLLLIS